MLSQKSLANRYEGILEVLNRGDFFGFITCDALKTQGYSDVFCPKDELGALRRGDHVSFNVHMVRERLHAFNVQKVQGASDAVQFFAGVLKGAASNSNPFGIIECKETFKRFGRDISVRSGLIFEAGLNPGDLCKFHLEKAGKGLMPHAKGVSRLTEADMDALEFQSISKEPVEPPPPPSPPHPATDHEYYQNYYQDSTTSEGTWRSLPTRVEGTMRKNGAANGKFGFIQSDDDGQDIFVLSTSCEEWDYKLPPIGTRVSYEVVANPQSGKPMAGNLKSVDGRESLWPWGQQEAEESATNSRSKGLGRSHEAAENRPKPSKQRPNPSKQEPDEKRQKTSGSAVLQLEDRHLGDDGLRNYLEQENDSFENSSFEVVNLAGNELTDAGLATLVEFLLAKQKPLKRLDLCRNRLVEPAALCEILQEGTCGLSSSHGLRTLALIGNPVTDVGFVSIFDAIYQLKINSGGDLCPPFQLKVDSNPPPGEAPDREDMFQTIAQMGLRICIVKPPPAAIDKDADVLLYLA